MEQVKLEFEKYTNASCCCPMFFCGDAANVLSEIPSQSIDVCLTSPPYWMKREYASAGIGLEEDYRQYIENLLKITQEVYRVLKPTGSFWLNIGDTYSNKALVGIPWRVALSMIDNQKWLLRNDVVWHKVKGPDNAKDKLRNVHENVFHFVKTKNFYYNVDAVRAKPREAKVVNGAIVSATGVTGVRYRRQIELSTSLMPEEKKAAFETLDKTLACIERGEISDFRMVIRKQHRVTHSTSEKLSGRAKELQQKGFYIMKYHRDGGKPSDVWEILPENRSNRNEHYATYPEDLCKIPLLATCPASGIVLDPFCGTGTTNRVAQQFERKSIGIDISEKYINFAKGRCR